ncbi:MAG: NifU family protein [Bacteroidales bacterium]|nr:NifU family protein [Bacteroidales bacterium]
MEEYTKEELNEKVQNVLEQLRPYLQQDGGDINFVEITDDNTVNVELLGACGSCAFSTMTLKNGVEATLKKALPQIKEVVAVNI